MRRAEHAMDLSFVTATSLGELTNAKSKRQIRQHASKEMWKVRKRDSTADADKALTVRTTRKPGRRAHEQSSQQIIVYPPSTRRVITDGRQQLGLMTPVSSSSDDEGGHSADQPDESEVVETIISPSLDRLGAGHLDPFTHYPIEINVAERWILYHALDDNLPVQLRYYKDFSYPLALADPASFCQFLSLFTFDVHTRYPGRIPGARDQAISYHLRALTHVNKQLEDPNFRNGEGLITSILGFLRYYCFLEDNRALRIHLQGLHQVIRLNGGIKFAFLTKEKENLVLLLCFTDVNVAYALDLPPTFPLPQNILSSIRVPPRPTPPPERPRLVRYLSEAWRRRFPGHDTVADILDELGSVTADLLTERARVGDRFFSSTVTPLLWIEPTVHCLLQQRGRLREPSDHVGWMEETFRVAALLYLGRLRRFDNEDSLMGALTARHVPRLRESLERVGKKDWSGLGPLRLWALVMGAMESNQGRAEMRRWYLDQMLAMAAAFRLRSAGDVEKAVKSMLWVDELFRLRADPIWVDLAESLPD
jgi:hypothetical protein